ncbi:uncharacterized protein L3040_008911 [Drepanopeziza brunnea f. sp. 'multigermtubi']|uniref:PinX1-related protein 1 n=1 Tax=Marssonina brunnea f. sp. multigermtubi (strain MB_m1) TaxID=1072389 RepID=K1WW59_MARBU|nr:putative Protein PXR1 [Drepanopeziza brunnea f. sp. 'multigermtubi' MB_m1]EKD17266.1 putative Protein PXR1 [Drepanopeziza brunnea f. sp. 'multigermtubi' MB_m1]KAJ5032304.1 hypothetical protein L3040_008911 [Drepanopeziza brunnea f. sp. 'multigermtubi']
MGLAGVKKRMKLSHDPNNTKWTNDSTSFGLKMMTAQGWTPGQYLGAKDAAHAEFHTAANASHIRVAIKDDNLGLGAKIGTGVGHGECTGLDAFKNLLGRLNGKEEAEIEKEQRSRDELRRAIYSERKWGTQRFVSGGFLIGDKIQILIDAEAERIRKLASGGSERSSDGSDSSEEPEGEVEVVPVEKTKKSKKRKAEALDESKPEVVAIKVKKSKKKRRVEEAAEQESAPFGEDKASKKHKKSNKDRKSKPKTEDTEEESESEFKRRKKEKKEKKERKRKEKVGSDDVEVEIEETEKEKRKREKKDRKEKKKKAAGEDTPEDPESLVPATKEAIPAVATSRAATMMQGRHAVRSRYIAQKRLASMDAVSLAQIFMIKSR